MEKKRQILGFLSVCTFCIFALMGPVGAVECGGGTYLDGGVCVSCPPEYPDSDAGATSINQCFVHYEGKCVAGTTCPENSKRCAWKTSEVISVDDYYGAPSKKTCKINTLYCNSGYYKTADNQACGLCADIPGFEGVYIKSTGSGFIEQCYKVCYPMCVRDACPAHGVCTYEDAIAGAGGIFYPTEDTIENCKPIVASSCAMQVDCVDTGYTTFDADTVTCNANTLTIKYNANGGVGSVIETTCLYDSACVAAGADTFTRQNWGFAGWNTAANGSGRSYAAGANITNIISDGEITLYAQWTRLNAKCEAGKYYDGENMVACPAGSFCPGIGEAPAGEAGCAVACPNSGQSEPGASVQSQCYVTCPAPASIKNGTLTRVNDKEYNNGTSDTYPVCRYQATCNAGYVAQNNNSVSPKCVWENPGDCPVGFYCPDGADEPIACPRIADDNVSPRGTSNKGTRAVTDCYYIFAPWNGFKNGSASGRCKYTGDAARYSACTLERVFSCMPGYYHVAGQTAGCTGVQSGYYSDGTTITCLSDNYNSAECVASLAQKPCPEQTTNSTVASAQFASSVTQCTKECVGSDVNGTLIPVNRRVNADASGTYAACTYNATCRAGYSAAGNGTANAHCVACPVGSYCDGTGADVTTGKQCKTLGDGSWNLSDAGASSASECYKECKQHDVINGTAIPVNPRAYWDNQCEYRGKSINGNDCDIVDGMCIETSCSNVYEMVNGLCRPCNREHALSYAPDGNCIIASCIIGYHVENGKCVADTRKCTAPHATSAYQTWDFKVGAYGTCVIDECGDGYHVASNACVSDIQACDIENGVGQMEWNHSARTWGNCVATLCDVGYTMDPSLTNERWKQCGQCKNKFSVRGEQAVSSYIRECEIGSCLYQGELYTLENNECIPICDVDGYEDETGTMKWDAEKHKCDRRCKSGYLMWQ